MNYQMLAAFAVGMFLLAASPGPGVIGSMTKAAAEGFKAALYFIGGLVIGDSLFFLLALFGISAISKVMGELFFIVKIAGGLYLIYIGYKMFRARSISLVENSVRKTSRLRTLSGGLLLTLGNPKPILFYASVLPAIIDLNNVHFIDGAAMLVTIAAISFIVLGTYSYFASLSRKFIAKPSAQEKVNKTAGIVMGLVGGYIILK